MGSVVTLGQRKIFILYLAINYFSSSSNEDERILLVDVVPCRTEVVAIDIVPGKLLTIRDKLCYAPVSKVGLHCVRDGDEFGLFLFVSGWPGTTEGHSCLCLFGLSVGSSYRVSDTRSREAT